MCAIAGLARRDPRAPVPAASIDAMRDAMIHRGPDDCGTYVAPGIGLGSRRLSIVDLSDRGRMPMSTPDGRFHIVYNGEIYNYRELRRELHPHGAPFVSNTDTEVLLRLYADQGAAMLDRLNGMFALAIWDSVERTLFLARDRLGIKPLYYTLQHGDLLFASEAKALFAAGVAPRFETSTLEELLCFRYVAGEGTPFAGVHRLAPGHVLTYRSGEVVIRRWWNLADRAGALRHSPPTDAPTWFKDTFESSVAYRRISDVPLGVLLSGGVDSASVASSLSEQAGRGVASFTVRFPGSAYDEGERARRVADAWGLEHHELVVHPDDLIEQLSFASGLNDEPLVHGSDLHLLAISRYAKPRVTVLLSGEGSDETLGGYVRYRPLRFPGALRGAAPLLANGMVASILGRRAAKLGRFLSQGSLEAVVLYNACEVLPDDLEALGLSPGGRFAYRERVLREAAAFYPREPIRQAMYSDQHTFLCSVLDLNDRMTMGASIECRVPFLDYRLVEGLAALPTSALMGAWQGKRLLWRALGHRLKPLLNGYRKWGFTAPWAGYLRQVPALREMVRAIPGSELIRCLPINDGAIRSAVEAFLRGDERQEALVRQLALLSVWHRAVIERRPRPTPLQSVL